MMGAIQHCRKQLPRRCVPPDYARLLRTQDEGLHEVRRLLQVADIRRVLYSLDLNLCTEITATFTCVTLLGIETSNAWLTVSTACDAS